MTTSIPSLETAQIEFLAQDCHVRIVPNFSHKKMHMISGDVGPFEAGLPVDVPLWLAINLRERQKCRIIPPTWMTVAELEKIKQEETDSDIFTEMPHEHYREIGQILLDVAEADIPKAEECQTLMKDIWDIRQAKVRSSIDSFIKKDEQHARVDYLTHMEINSIRSPFMSALKLALILKKPL